MARDVTPGPQSQADFTLPPSLPPATAAILSPARDTRPDPPAQPPLSAPHRPPRPCVTMPSHRDAPAGVGGPEAPEPPPARATAAVVYTVHGVSVGRVPDGRVWVYGGRVIQIRPQLETIFKLQARGDPSDPSHWESATPFTDVVRSGVGGRGGGGAGDRTRRSSFPCLGRARAPVARR